MPTWIAWDDVSLLWVTLPWISLLRIPLLLRMPLLNPCVTSAFDWHRRALGKEANGIRAEEALPCGYGYHE